MQTPSQSGITGGGENGSAVLKKCYCGFVCEGVDELKAHILKVHGARDGDWRTWEAR